MVKQVTINVDDGTVNEENVSDVPESSVITASDVKFERMRRISGGFSYDFGNSRGLHEFSTKQKDVEGWNECTRHATAMINAGSGTSTFTIYTETGPATVSADEWNGVVVAWGDWSQAVWDASEALSAMDPIPADYADDSRWPSNQLS